MELTHQHVAKVIAAIKSGAKTIGHADADPVFRAAGVTVEQAKGEHIALNQYWTADVTRAIEIVRGRASKAAKDMAAIAESDLPSVPETTEEASAVEVPDEVSSRSIDALDVSDAIKTRLRGAGYETIGSLLALTEEQINNINGIGASSVAKIGEAIDALLHPQEANAAA